MERFFSVVVEREDGRTETVRVSGLTPGAAFQQAKGMPGVRRVGKVAEVGAGGPPAARNGSPTPGHPSAPAAPAPGRSERAAGYDPKVGFVLTGPRVVVHARPSGGEQPFKHLQAPPEQYGPPKPPPPPKPVVVVAPPPPPAPVQPVVAETAKAAPVAEAPSSPAYRIMKSRRRDGMPYLLQRGTWRDAGGKRVFEANWEKGFPAREQAEQHLAWLEEHERDMAADGDEVLEADDDDQQDDVGAEELAEMDYQAA